MATGLIPDGLPELKKGRHGSPADGACFMEYVSILAGEPFSDRPACVDPLLVGLAWAINDISGSAIRAQLPDLAPRFIGTANGGLQLAPLLVIACCTHARVCLGPTHGQYFARASARAERRLQRVQTRLAAGRRVRGERPFRLCAEATIGEVVRAVAVHDERQLPHLLRVAVDVAEETSRTTSTSPMSLAPASLT
jgi:hypothetical protein